MVNVNGAVVGMSIVNGGVIVEHGCRIGEFALLSTGAVVEANATIILEARVDVGCVVDADGVVRRLRGR